MHTGAVHDRSLLGVRKGMSWLSRPLPGKTGLPMVGLTALLT